MPEIKRQLVAFINGASPRIARFLFGRMTTPSEAEINTKLAEKYGEIAKEMRSEEKKEPKLSEKGNETVTLLRKFLETSHIEHLEEARDTVKPSCKSCAKNIQRAIDAYNAGDEEEAKELTYGMIGALIMGKS